MTIETVTGDSVSLRISRAELGARDTLTPQEARAAVCRALESSGQPLWARMEISLFPGDTEVLVIARPVQVCPHLFRFGCFEHLAAASVYLDPETEADLLYIDGAFALLIRSEESRLPNALFEFGSQRPCTPEFAAHLREQGELIAAKDAARVLQRHFV